MATSISSVSQVSDLAKMIVQKYDTNGDGSLSSAEFGSFLTNLLGGMGATTSTGTTVSTAATTLLNTTTDASATRAKVGTMSGFDWGKMNDPSHQTFKYQIGRILQYYPNTAAGLQDALPEIQQLVPGAKIIGTNGDKIDFGDYVDPKAGRIGVVDVIIAAGGARGGDAWAWQPVES